MQSVLNDPLAPFFLVYTLIPFVALLFAFKSLKQISRNAAAILGIACLALPSFSWIMTQFAFKFGFVGRALSLLYSTAFLIVGAALSPWSMDSFYNSLIYWAANYGSAIACASLILVKKHKNEVTERGKVSRKRGQ